MKRSTKSMDHEEEFLYTFFTHVSQLCFEKAKESVEKEKESCRSTQMGPWGMLLTYLPQVAMTERSYSDLGFLHTKNKGFLRKDTSLKTTYDSLKADLKKLEEVTKGTNASGATVSEVSNQLCSFISVRMQLIDFYEKMYNMSTNGKVTHQRELLQSIKGIVQNHYLLCSHMTLTAIKAALTLECEILEQLTNAQIQVQNWRFLPCIIALYGAQTRMAAWERTLQNKESWKLGFGATFLKANQQPALYQWLVKLRGATLAKCSLYFHTTLSQQSSPGDMRGIMSKQSVDYYQKMQHFQRKHDAIAVALVFDSRNSQDFGSGYRHPKRELNVSENFSYVVTCPYIFMQKPSVHWSTIKKSVEERHSELLSMDKIVFVKSAMDLINYALLNIDLGMTLVVVYEGGKQKDKDSLVSIFMTEISAQLRCNKVYESLKLSK